MSASTIAAASSDRAAAAEPWRWEIVASVDAAEALVPAWQALALDASLPTFAGPAFTLAHRAAFVRRRDPLALHALHRGGTLLAVIPLLRQRGVVETWRAPANEHNSCWGFAMRSDLPEVARRVLDHLLGTADRLSFLRFPREGPEWRSLRDAAAELGLPVVVRGTWQGDTWVALPASLQALEAAMPNRLAHDLQGKLRRLGRRGRVELERIEDGPELAPALEACFALEAQGWKGFTGVPVKDDPCAYRFYCELARRASAAGQLALYLLRVDGQLIAFRYCLRAGGRLDSLKTSFAPEWARYSPGLLVQLLVARREVEDGTARSVHVGQPDPHKLRWATGVQPLGTLEIYSRRPRGRLASWPPRMLHAITRFPPARGLASRSRALALRLRELRHEARVRAGKRLSRRRGGRTMTAP